MALRTHSSSVKSLFALVFAVLVAPAAFSQTASERLAVLEFKGDGIKDEVLRSLREHGRILVAKSINSRPAVPTPARALAVEPDPAPTPASKPVAGCAANQVAIPGGKFRMGSKDGRADEKPVHKVTLFPYCIDKTEVTVAAFKACVQAGACRPPGTTVDCTWGKSGMDQHPINCVSWHQATEYCQWTGGRLPNEAEWEFAARGRDGRKYPWGDAAPDATLLNADFGDDGWPTTAPVGKFPKGASPFGVLDMAGNVWEWTSDGHAPYGKSGDVYRRSGLGESPRVYRGGSWNHDDPFRVRAAFRFSCDPNFCLNIVGFRCASGAKK